MKVKLCGFTDKDSVSEALANKVDFIGFVFCKGSVRYISPNQVAEISRIIPSTTAKVAVLADSDMETISEIHKNLAADYFQFHGHETVEFLQKVKEKFPQVKIIKAFRVATTDDLAQVDEFNYVADLFLFDSKSKSSDGVLGGSGEVFNWKILHDFKSKKDWFLSGGLNAGNVIEALQISGANMVDISSGIEKIRGQKSPELIKQLMEILKNYVA